MKKITLLLLVCFSSLMGFSQGLVEGFDNTAAPSGGVLALDSGSWAIFDNEVGTQGSWLPTASPALVHQGTRAMQINGTNDNLGIGNTSQDWLVTPAVIVPNNGQLKFFTRQQTSGNQGSIFQIRISTTSQTDPSSFLILQEWNELNLNAAYNVYEEKTVPLNLPAGSTVYVAFVMLNTQVGPGISSERWLVDTVNIVEQCLDPTNLTASAVTQSGANLSWLNPSGATSWEIEIVSGTTPTPTGHGVVYNGALPYAATGTATGDPLVQAPFIQNTQYKYYVRALCTGSNTSSAWVGPFTFTTGAPGFTCSSAIPITGLPYTTTDNTSNYSNSTNVNQGIGCGATANYMTGNDVFYSYTATETGVISISMTPTATWSGLFVYNGCANVGVSCIAGVANSQTTVREIPVLSVTEGVTYIIAISTNSTPLTTGYTLNIQKVNCTPPTNLNVTNVTATSATLTWDNPGNLASTWQVALQDAGTPMPTTEAGVVTVTTNTAYQPTLVDSHAYQYYVRAQCPDGSYSAWAGPYLFNSAQVAATIPFTEGFEGSNTFALNNGNQVNKWAVGTATNNGGTKSMYISNTNGTTNVYDTGTTTVVQAYRDILIPTTANELNLAFDWKAVGETLGTTFYDYFRVWIVPTSFTPLPGTQIAAGADRVQLGANFNSSSNFATVNYVIQATAYAGQTRRLVFEWRNDGSGGAQPPAAIDNINITQITCSAPTALVAQTVGQTSATFGWTAPTAGATSYDYYVSPTNTTPAAGVTVTGNVAATTATIGGLAPSSTSYVWVRSNCGTDGTSTWTGPLTIMTTQVPGDLAYTDGFEGTNQWSLINGSETNKWVIGTATSNGGTQSLYISNTNGTTNAYSVTNTTTVHAYRDLNVPATANELNVAFDWRAVGESTFDYIRVWAVPTTFNPTPGAQITAGAGRVQLGGNINNSANYTTANYVLPAAGFAGQTMRLVFEWRNDGFGGTQPPAAIDNVVINVITCSAPSALVVNSTNQTGGTFSWTAPTAGAASYDYYISTTNTPPTSASTVVNVTPTTATVTGLPPSTTHYVWVRSNCGATDGTSTWIGPVQLITTQIPGDLNYIDGFEGTNNWTLNNGTQVNKWIVGTATSNGGTQSLYISNNNAANAYTTGSSSVVHAYRDVQMPALIGDLSLTFDWKAVGEGFTSTFYDYFRVWVVPTSFNPVAGTQITAGAGRFQLGANFNNSATWQTPSYIFSANTFSGQAMRLIFEWRNDGSGGTQPPAAIDNINLSQLTCPAPINLLAQGDPSSSELELSWTPVGSETQWEVVTQVAGTGVPVSGQIVNTPSLTYTATPGVFYEFYVRAICSDSDSSLWAGPSAFSIFSPPGCASVDLVGVGVDIIDQEIILCAEEDNCVDLSATYFGIGATTSYDVASIDYNPPFPFTGGTEMNITTDDIWSPTIQLPFNFCFFGESYSTAQVGSNGVLTFDQFTAPGNCPWQFNGQTIPNTAFPIKNAIYGVYQDLNPNITNPSGPVSINYQVLGTYPCRALVVNFSNVLQFQCGVATGPQTSQIVIYEISNIIEVYVERRVPCMSWPSGANGGQGVIGIQNEAGTLAYSPAGRNTGSWSATEEAYRFSPNGESNVDFQWLKNGEFYSNQQDIEVCVTELTTMVAQATYTTCDGAVITKENQVTIRTTEPLPTNDPVDIISCSSTGNPIFDLTPNTATIIGSNSATDLIIEYYLTQAEADLGDSTTAIATPEAFAGTPGQTIFVRISYPGSDCFFVKSFQLQLGTNSPSVTTFSYSTPICIGNATNPLPIPVTGFTAGGTYSSNDVTVNAATGEIDMTTATAGTHDITYTITPTGCNEGGSFTAQIVINALPVADDIADVVVCDSYVLQPLSANNNYFTAPNGGGSALTAGTAITTSQLIYIYTSTGVGCSDESDFNVTINVSPIVSVTGACQGSNYIIEAAILNDNLSADNFIFSWTDSDGNSVGGNTPTITVSVSGEYFVNVAPVVSSTVDCSVDQAFTANGTTCMIPKGISPNGDGKNDTFDLTGLQVRKISIFNRYGTIVYDYSNYTDQWHGQSNKGDELPDGTYYYSFEREGGESKTGWVYINRQRN